MSTALAIHDETTSGERRHSLTLHLPEPTITARELIRARVFEEVRSFNETLPEHCQGLVQPKERRRLDWHEQARVAVEAFERNGFLLLVNGRQIETLEEEIRIRPETTVTFLKLVPLVGG